MWGEMLDYFYATDRKPRIQLVHCVFDKILLVIGSSPLAVGCILGFVFWTITAIAAFPLFLAVAGMMRVSDAIALSLENVYHIIKRWTSRIWRRILGNRKGLTTDLLPTTNTPVVNHIPKQSQVSSLASSISTETKNDERNFALHSNPVITTNYIPSGPVPIFPSPCAEIRGRSRETDSHVTVFPPPPYS
ncbi:uncharacterized protein EAE97_010281 [Botrytis byssoidea]|uniref:Uncharacterized protein n=1 Tax=Botrytis byssoidea TaxID=139641 RepID=A0A9P5I4M6_9HELO|nr:uncharacterized protein EAE97_010281 [Botrytis byssoidea]KAF7926772.1 hypothetical protein EAE97_010281 [Botrytis byssoidea]